MRECVKFVLGATLLISFSSAHELASAGGGTSKSPAVDLVHRALQAECNGDDALRLQLLTEARRALASLEELARRRERSVIERDAAIMRFAYTFEAVWKAAQLYLYEHEGLEVGSPKQSIRAPAASAC